jgi:secreted Zn-dependent insulinase-like peptidase
MLISSNTNPYDISEHIDNFVNDFITKSGEDLTEEKFETLKQSLTSKTLEPFHSLSDYFDFVCQEINRGTFLFDRKTNAAQLKAVLDKITK